MKFINWWVNNFTIGGFFIVNVLSAIFSLILIGSLFFGYHPYYKTKSGWAFGFADFEKGIPVDIKFNGSLPDTMINLQTKTGGISGGEGTKIINEYIENLKSKGDTTIIKADSITLGYEVNDWSDWNNIKRNSKEFGIIRGMKFNSGSVHIEPVTFRGRFIFQFPIILLLLLMSYGFWQFAMFLQYIQSDSSFDPSNYKRLRNIGLALLWYNLILLVLDHYFYRLTFIIHRSSTKMEYGSYLTFSANPDLPYGLSYFLAGAIFLILATAFKKGHQLQQEQDLTI